MRLTFWEVAARARVTNAGGRVDVMVVGSRGYGPLTAVLLGGVSGQLIRSAACPVIVVPRGADSAIGSLFGPSAVADAG